MNRMLQWWLTLGAAGAFANIEHDRADRERENREVDALLARLDVQPAALALPAATEHDRVEALRAA
jgi:hypothetical protein